MKVSKRKLLTSLPLFQADRDMTWHIELHWRLDLEDGQRLDRAVVSVCPGPGPPLGLYSTAPRHLVWLWLTGCGPGLQLQNIPTESEAIIRQVLSGEDLTIKVTGTCRWKYCLTHVFILMRWQQYRSTLYVIYWQLLLLVLSKLVCIDMDSKTYRCSIDSLKMHW